MEELIKMTIAKVTWRAHEIFMEEASRILYADLPKPQADALLQLIHEGTEDAINEELLKY